MIRSVVMELWHQSFWMTQLMLNASRNSIKHHFFPAVQSMGGGEYGRNISPTRWGQDQVQYVWFFS
jgi:hypothetical protein